MKLLSTLRMHVLRLLHGGSFQVWHVDNRGRRKVFWCDTLQDALEWVACSHRDEDAMVLDHAGCFVALRKAMV